MPEKRDLLIHYDEAAQRLVVQAVPSDRAEALRDESPEGIGPDLDELRELAPDAAEQHVGRLVLALVDLHSERKIGVRDYAAEADREQARYVAELEARVAAGEADAQFELFIQLQLAALKTGSLPLLERADALLAAAVAQGHQEAAAMAENWPMIKSMAERRIARQASGG
ncbi:MAG: hypothetical protein ABJD97_03120 [Betaproteobacteria bacterium]